LKLALVSPLIDCGDVAPPLNLAILAAYVREKHPDLEVAIFDGTVNKDAYFDIDKFAPDVLAVTATTPQVYEAYSMMKTIRSRFPKVFIVMGGVHASALPEEAAKHADCVVVGDGEIALSNIIGYLEKGLPISKIIEGQEIAVLDSLPYPAYDLLDLDRYMYRSFGRNLKPPKIPLMTSRGCNHRCPFCWNSQRKVSVRYHSAEYVLKEILFLEAKYHIKSIWFHDDEFIENKSRLMEFLAGFKKYGLHKRIIWACQSRVTSITSPDIPKMLKEAGCVSVFLGIESVTKSLKFLKCGEVNREDVETAIRCFHEAKLTTSGSFILGTPDQSLGEMEENWNWIVDHRHKGLNSTGFAVLSPYPGSAIYIYALKHGVFTQENVDYGRISISHDVRRNYVIDKAVSVEAFDAFLKDKLNILWSADQVTSKKIRSICTPTFLRTCLKHPKTMWRMLV
jgi:radical SAM superfamily enzyme YgiQ (UPF0313 family)